MRYFTALDLQSGYYHMKLDDESIPKSAFTIVFGKFEFPRLPCGLCQCPDFFIHLTYDLFGLEKTPSQGQGSGYLAYLDDILICNRTEKEQLEMLDKSFKCLLKARLKIKLSKGSFCKDQIHYFSCLVSVPSIFNLLTKLKHL